MKITCRAAVAAAALAALLTLSASPARAFYSAELFGDLTGELVERRDNDLAEPVTKPEKKQLAAITKSLARFDAPADDFGDDAASLGLAARLLQPAFPDEFGPLVLAKTLRLGTVFATALEDLRAAIEADLVALEARVAPLGGKFGRAAQKAAAKARKVFDSQAALDPYRLTARAAKLTSAVRGIQKASKLADKATPQGTGGISATIDGDAYTADTAAVEIYRGDDTFHFDASRDIGGGAAELIYVSIRGVTGPGTYAFTGGFGSYGGYYGIRTAEFDYTTWNIVEGSGSVTVTTWDLAGEHVAGTFTFDGTDPIGPNGTRAVRAGTFDIRGGFTFHAGDGFLSKR